MQKCQKEYHMSISTEVVLNEKGGTIQSDVCQLSHIRLERILIIAFLPKNLR